MDVAFGASNVFFSGRNLIQLLLFVLAGFFFGAPLWATQEKDPIHFSADKEIWDKKNNKHELFGHAMVRQPGETLMADSIVFDQHSRTLDAHGNCLYVTSEVVIHGEEMHFNLDTRTGTIVSGWVSNDRFTLGGERLNKLGDGRFQTHLGQYSTCKDCAKSWTLQAEDVDMQFEGYAYLSNVTVKVKDAPGLWLPYLILPMKSHRQSGFLFPIFSVSQQNGFAFVQPFFWAINRSADMTLGLGEYTARGTRATWEARYALSPRSGGKFNYYFLRDKTFIDPILNPKGNTIRWAFEANQTQELPFGIEAKLHWVDFSDHYYPIFIGDVPSNGERDMLSTASLSYSSSDLSAYVVGKHIRNLLDTHPDPDLGVRRFDPTTVQLLPGAEVTTNDQLLWEGAFTTGLTLGISNFTRKAGSFDPDTLTLSGTSTVFRPDVDVLREATRVSVTPTIYTALRPWGLASLTPSMKYFGTYYSFHSITQNFYQSYVLFQTDLSTHLERIYETSDPDRPLVKHLIRPFLTYSLIPESWVRQDKEHPFYRQIHRGMNGSVVVGNYFDNTDIVPIDVTQSTVNYYLPLGNTLSYGVTTQLIERKGALDKEGATYSTPLEWTVGSALNMQEYTRPSSSFGPRPLTRIYSNLHGKWRDQVESTTSYFYYPYAEGIRHQLTTSVSYILERSLHQRILSFDRSFNLTYNYGNTVSSLTGGANFSLSDYILPSVNFTYDLIKFEWINTFLGVQFQSPSQCWKFNIGTNYSLQTGSSLQVDASINLTGSGFGGATEIVSQATDSK